MEKRIEDRSALREEAQHFIQTLAAGERATLVTLSGELGAGKTAFTQEVALALGIEVAITSPTFVLEKIYELPAGAPFKRLVHIDAYRLGSAAELSALGFDELMRDPGNLVMLEWPERVEGALPQTAIALTLVPHEDGSRTLVYG